MALVSGTTTTYDLKGNREDLQDKIFNVAPSDTPLISMIGTSASKATKHEWQTDTFAAASLTNAQLEGDDYAYSTAAATVRVGNYTQISTKSFLITGTQEKVDKAGRASEIRYQAVKRGIELKLDMEATLLANQASVAGAAGTARKLGGFAAWMTSNVSRGATGANGGYNTGTGVVDAATNGTQRAFASSQIDSVMQSAATNSNSVPSQIFLKAGDMVLFQAFTQRATAYRDVNGNAKIVAGGNVAIYASQFGDLAAHHHFLMSNNASTIGRNAYLVNPRYAKVSYLRRMFRDQPAKTGDAEKNVMVCEYTLEMNNQAAHGIIADLT